MIQSTFRKCRDCPAMIDGPRTILCPVCKLKSKAARRREWQNSHRLSAAEVRALPPVEAPTEPIPDGSTLTRSQKWRVCDLLADEWPPRLIADAKTPLVEVLELQSAEASLIRQLANLGPTRIKARAALRAAAYARWQS